MRRAVFTLTGIALLCVVAAVVAFIANFREIENLSGILGAAAFGFAMIALVVQRSGSRT